MKKINTLQLTSMLIMLVVSATFGKGFYTVIKSSGVDSWISVIIAGIIGFLIIFAYLYISNYEPDLSLPEKNKKLFGNIFGTIINYLITIIIFITSVSLFYDLTGFISSQFLQETPTFVIGIMFILIIIYINIKGIEVISRTSFALMFIGYILFFISFFGLLPQFDISNVKPFLEFGLTKPLNGSLYILMLNIMTTIVLLIIPKNSLVDYKKLTKRIIIFYIISIIMIFLVVFLTLGNLGIDLTKLYSFPEYVVLKRINIFGFIDRIENILVMQWIFSIFINISLCIYFMSNTIKKGNNKIITFILSFLLLIISNTVFKNTTLYNTYVYNIAIYFKYILVAIVILIIIKIKYNRRAK